MPLTQEQKQEYVKSPFKCPYCGSDDIEAKAPVMEDINSYSSVDCNSCAASWTDVWQIVNIWEDD